jgi:hypothetical protein
MGLWREGEKMRKMEAEGKVDIGKWRIHGTKAETNEGK